ncbi:hypothetical protein [Vibrio anguillarum]|uniref:Uncharacterized protein n=1 Tax=Vibrio anguillarum TaxID=55601 RepID=A0ABR9ZDW6_VIBAN|nr:hypothetical protein [Vibrio anguillarum]MBF4376192.1 hypothetical protein [Vibrio anguillarum]
MNNIKKAVDGVMSLRPAAISSRYVRDVKKAEVMKRMSDLQFQKEMQSIMDGDIPSKSIYFFDNIDPNKAYVKNIQFNAYDPSRKQITNQ